LSGLFCLIDFVFSDACLFHFVSFCSLVFFVPLFCLTAVAQPAWLGLLYLFFGSSRLTFLLRSSCPVSSCPTHFSDSALPGFFLPGFLLSGSFRLFCCPADSVRLNET
jgi:hypothetical protein